MISNETLLDNGTISLPPKTILGYRENGMPIYNIAGGSVDVTPDSDADDNDAVEEVEDDDDDASDEVSNTEETSWTPPSREQFERLLAEKKRADSEAAARKRLLRDAGLDPKTGKPIEKHQIKLDLDDLDDTVASTETPNTDTSGFSRERLEKQFQRNLERETALAEQRARNQVLPLITAVPKVLTDAGWNGKNMDRMMKLLDLDAIEVHSDGDIEGLVEQVDELKKDFPEFFKRTRMREAVKEVADSSTVGGGNKKAPASEEEQDFKARMKRQILRGGS